MTGRHVARLVHLNDGDVRPADPAEDVRGRKVIDSNGEEIGRTDDVIIDDVQRVARFLKVVEGGFLGLGTTRFLIPVDAIVRVSRESLRVDRDRDQVAAAPGYDPDLTPEHLELLYRYYGYAPYWAADYSGPDCLWT